MVGGLEDVDGLGVGADVGDRVDGSLDGLEDDGLGVGADVGRRVGALLLVDVGVEVVGFFDGLEVIGLADGLYVGSGVGLGVGANVFCGMKKTLSIYAAPVMDCTKPLFLNAGS